MKIQSITIQNFRSIKNATFTANNFNILVGQNNAGKTNFFEAIEFFFNGLGKQNIDELRFDRDSSNEILVEVTFSGAQNGLTSMLNEGNRAKMDKALHGEDIVTFQRSSTEPKKRVMLLNGGSVSPPTGFDTALNDFLPKFEYINTKQYYDSVAKFGRSTPIGNMLSGVLSSLLEDNEHYKEFQEKFENLFGSEDSSIKAEFDKVGGKVKMYLEKQFPDCTEVKFEVTAPVFDDLLKNFDTSINDGVVTNAEEKGDGMQRALMLSIIQVYSDYRKENEDRGKSFIFFIDEAELHLHPTAQRNLKNALLQLSFGNDQVFINTHSSVFVADELEGQSIFKVEKNNKKTTIEAVSVSQKPYVVYDLLGGSPSDLLLPNNFLIVEGKSEIELITRVIERFYSDKPRIQLIPAKGDVYQADRTINAIEKAFTPLSNSIYKSRLVILMDKPSSEREGGVNEFIRNNASLKHNQQVFFLEARDLEQCYPDYIDHDFNKQSWRKTQEQLDAESFNSEKKVKLAKRVGLKITQEQFEAELMRPIYNALCKCWDLAYN